MRRMVVFLAAALFAACGRAELVQREWTVEGATRRALVHFPATAPTNGSPLVYVFHGHGGNARGGARKFKTHELWPEAIVVYMQGLPTKGQLTDPEGKKNGWNCDPADTANRDLKFFDAVHAALRGQADPKRVFGTGHSNGGSFTFCLWAARGDLFAAMAPSAASGGRSTRKLTPKPALHIAGKNDPLVKYAWQERTMRAVRRLNGCAEKGEPWAASGTLAGTLYTSKTGTPLVTLLHPGGHEFPAAAPELIVRFFKERPR